MSLESAPGDRLLRIGAVVMIVGLACTLVALLPLVFPSLELPSLWWFLSMLTGVGLALVLLGLVVSARSRRRHDTR
jgi:VIT1/CCC1 family predicted Fe2+/Mn2+ transporter